METEAREKDVAVVTTRPDRTSYDSGSIALHWATVVLVLSQYGLAQSWDFFARESAARHLLIGTHISLGILLTAVIALRIAWRLGPNAVVFADKADWMDRIARWVHRLIYVLLVTEIGLGWTLGWSHGKDISFFGLIDFASPISLSATHRSIVHGLHEWTANILMLVVGLHACAALFHQYVLRDDILWRMLPRRLGWRHPMRPSLFR